MTPALNLRAAALADLITYTYTAEHDAHVRRRHPDGSARIDAWLDAEFTGWRELMIRSIEIAEGPLVLLCLCTVDRGVPHDHDDDTHHGYALCTIEQPFPLDAALCRCTVRTPRRPAGASRSVLPRTGDPVGRAAAALHQSVTTLSTPAHAGDPYDGPPRPE